MLKINLKNNILSFLENTFFLNKKFKTNDDILIFGSKRSGTTWLMEIISAIPEYITIFEPFHPIWFPSSRKFMPTPEKNQEELHNYLNKILEGKIYCKNPIYRPTYKNIKQRVTGNKLLIKFVRANNLIGYIKNNFAIKSIFYIIRNPYSVVSSQIRTNIIPDIMYRNNFSLQEPIESYLTEYWFKEQIEALNIDDIIKIKYEDLVLEPEKYIKKILSKLEYEEYIDKIIKNIRIASHLTERKRNTIDTKIVDEWKNELTEVQIKNIRIKLESYEFNYDKIKSII